jgi:hypothetical protein
MIKNKSHSYNFELVHVFSDDHLPCCHFLYNDREYSIYWTNHDVIGAIKYSDSKKAQKLLNKLIKYIGKVESFWQNVELTNPTEYELDQMDPFDFEGTEFGDIKLGHE